jgi:SAM-dependent methyltransferase
MIDLKCPVCGLNTLSSNNSHPYPNATPRENHPQQIVFCSQCGLGVGYPLLSDDELDKLYSGAQYWAQSNPKLSVRRQPILHALANSRWSFILSALPERLKKKDSLAILDIGAGYGYLGLVAAKSPELKINSYTVVEPDKNLHAALKKAWPHWSPETGLETYSSIDPVNQKFDIIVLSHVVEHVKAPLEIIEKAVSNLTDDGILFIEVPNRDYLFKSDVFPHLLFFSPESLENLVVKASLEVITIEGWGRRYERSPLYKNAPLMTKSAIKIISIAGKLLPGCFGSLLVAFLFGINKRHSQGTWIRCIACCMRTI